ncbi:MAG: PqqD family protein [Terriglobia bacterium]|jgi:hypothetical protein
MPQLYIARSRQIAARELDGETMIMSASDSRLFNLNELGTLMWQAADGATSLENIVDEKVCTQYDVKRSEALRDAQAFVRELAEHGILLICGQPISVATEAEQS